MELQTWIYWCRDELYEKYALELIRKEGVETAMERSLKTMMEWGDDPRSTHGKIILDTQV